MSIDDILSKAEGRLGSESSVGDILSSAESRVDDKQKLRSAFQGLTFGFADEIEAIARSAVTSQSYDEAAAEIRQKLKDYQESHPMEAISMEMLGAAAPTAFLLLTGVGTPAALTTGSGLLRSAGIGAATSGVTAFGTGEGGFAERAERVPSAALVGGIASPVIGAAISGSGTALSSLTNFIRSKFGDRLGSVVQAEVNRLAEETGKTPDDIINDLMSGRLMTENESLVRSLRAYRGHGGPAASHLEGVIKGRVGETQSKSIEDLQRGLAPDTVDDNTYRTIRMGEKELKSKEGEAYNQIFAARQEVSMDMVDLISEAMVRMPGAAAKLKDMYQARGGIVPFYEIAEDGSMKIIRQPTVEDAEIVRRALSEATSKAYKEGEGTIGEALGGLEKSLRSKLDVESPDLQATRANWASIMSAREAFEAGQKLLTGNVEMKLSEIQDILQSGTQAQVKALRAGFMSILRHKFASQGTTAGRLSDEKTSYGMIFNELYPNARDRDRVLFNLETTAKAKEVSGKVFHGSPTSQDLMARQRVGERVSAGDIQGVLAGHLPSMSRAARGIVDSIAPKLSDQQREEVVRIITTKDPDVLRRAFTDETAMAELQQKIGGILAYSAASSKMGILQQFGEASGDIAPLNLGGE